MGFFGNLFSKKNNNSKKTNAQNDQVTVKVSEQNIGSYETEVQSNVSTKKTEVHSPNSAYIDFCCEELKEAGYGELFIENFRRKNQNEDKSMIEINKGIAIRRIEIDKEVLNTKINSVKVDSLFQSWYDDDFSDYASSYKKHMIEELNIAFNIVHGHDSMPDYINALVYELQLYGYGQNACDKIKKQLLDKFKEDLQSKGRDIETMRSIISEIDLTASSVVKRNKDNLKLYINEDKAMENIAYELDIPKKMLIKKLLSLSNEELDKEYNIIKEKTGIDMYAIKWMSTGKPAGKQAFKEDSKNQKTNTQKSVIDRCLEDLKQAGLGIYQLELYKTKFEKETSIKSIQEQRQECIDDIQKTREIVNYQIDHINEKILTSLRQLLSIKGDMFIKNGKDFLQTYLDIRKEELKTRLNIAFGHTEEMPKYINVSLEQLRFWGCSPELCETLNNSFNELVADNVNKDPADIVDEIRHIAVQYIKRNQTILSFFDSPEGKSYFKDTIQTTDAKKTLVNYLLSIDNNKQNDTYPRIQEKTGNNLKQLLSEYEKNAKQKNTIINITNLTTKDLANGTFGSKNQTNTPINGDGEAR